MKNFMRFVWAVILFVPYVGGISAAEVRCQGKPLVEVSGGTEVIIMSEHDSPFLVGRDRGVRLHSDFYGMEFYSGERGFKSRLMIMWNLVDYLDLDEDTAASFFPIFNEYTQKRDKLTKTHRELVEQIVDDVENEDVSMGELKKLIEKLEDIDGDIRKERKAFLEKAKTILDDRQYVKLVIFNDKLKKDLFRRFSGRRISVTVPEMPEIKIPGIDTKGIVLEEYKKAFKELQRQQKELERQQKNIEKLIKKK